MLFYAGVLAPGPEMHLEGGGRYPPQVIQVVVDTTKARSGPQRVRMSSGERSIGAAKGKQSDIEALPPPPPPARAPSLSPATVPLTPSAGLNGICNRQ